MIATLEKTEILLKWMREGWSMSVLETRTHDQVIRCLGRRVHALPLNIPYDVIIF